MSGEKEVVQKDEAGEQGRGYIPRVATERVPARTCHPLCSVENSLYLQSRGLAQDRHKGERLLGSCFGYPGKGNKDFQELRGWRVREGWERAIRTEGHVALA